MRCSGNVRVVKPLIETVVLSAMLSSLMMLAGCGGNGTMAVQQAPIAPQSTEVNSCKGVKTVSPAQPAPMANFAGVGFTGVVRAGSMPVVGSAVTIYAAGATGNGSAATAVVGAPSSTLLTTDANGVFSVPATFVCPLSDSVVYAVARGGQAGANANDGLHLATVLGTCNSIKSGASFTINEVTTVATAYAMSQFVNGEDLGATSTNSTGIALAAATMANLVNVSTGEAPGAGFPTNATEDAGKIHSLANALNSCTTTGTGSAACGKLYAAAYGAASSSSNTLGAVVSVAKSPGMNVAALYAVSQGSGAYGPALTGAPADWTMRVSYRGGGMNSPSAVAIDSTGEIWVASYNGAASLFTNLGLPVFAHGITGNNLEESYGAAVDVNDVAWIANEQSAGSVNNGGGSMTLLSNAGVSPANYAMGGIYFPSAVAFDTSGVAWVTDYGNSSVTLLGGDGTPLSGAKGYSAKNLMEPVAVATDAMCNAYVGNQSGKTVTLVTADGSSFTDFTVGNGPSGIAIDAGGHVWTANFYGDSVGLVYGGKVISGSGFTGGGLNHPQGIAADGAGNVWVANYRAPGLTELASAAVTTPEAVLSPTAGWGADSGMAESFGIAIDASGNVWVSNVATNTLTEFVGIAAPVKTPLLGPVRLP